MILDFHYDKKTGDADWRFKGEIIKTNIDNAQIVRNYEFLEKIFVIKIENKTSVLYIYDAKGNLYDKIISTKDFFIAGIRGGILQPEFLIKRKGKEDKIFIYETKKRKFVDTGEVIKSENLKST